jgi:hypothetical protein
MDLFNAAAGDRDGVFYGAVVTRAKPPSLAGALEIGIDPVSQAQHALYYNLSRLASGYAFPAPDGEYEYKLREAFGEAPGNEANDGIVPTLSQPWGRCIAVAQADHLDIIGHYTGEKGDLPDERHYDWLTTRSDFRTPQFVEVCTRIVDFLGEAEEARG